MNKIRKWIRVGLLGIVIVMALAGVLAMPVMATDVTVNATPSFISFSSAPTDWVINGITGSGLIDENTTYYSNPLGDTTAPAGANVVDGECYFTWTNDSTVDIDVTVNCGSFTGGDADMTNGNSGSNGASTYGAYSWYSGLAYANKVIVKSSGSSVLYTTSSPGEDKKWGAEIKTRTDTWTGSDTSSATMTITATED
jgi:hypothetical protein